MDYSHVDGYEARKTILLSIQPWSSDRATFDSSYYMLCQELRVEVDSRSQRPFNLAKSASRMVGDWAGG